jgi:dethiobiotin synthetase
VRPVEAAGAAGRRIVVVGTGTEIGKTHVGVALVTALAAAGHEVAGLKPVESGVGTGVTDSELLGRAGTFHVKQPPPYALRAPISPHRAAAMEGITLQLGPIVAWVDGVGAAWILVETAGGLLSPLGAELTNLDLACALKPDLVVLVAPDRLGVLHDVTATMFALHVLAPDLPEPLVVLQAPAEGDASTGTNAEELLALEIVRTVATVPRGAPGSVQVQLVVAEVLQMLGIDPPAAPPGFT